MSTSFAATRAALAAGRALRVVNWHNTPAGQEGQLRAELTEYRERYRVVGLDDLDAVLETGRWPAAARPGPDPGPAEDDDRPGLLPVFYDAYREGHDVAARVCDDLGVRALFMPPTALLSVPVAQQRAFADAHDVDLLPGSGAPRPGLVDPERLAMTWDELASVAGRHEVGGHTATHARAAEVVTSDDVEREVTAPLRELALATGARVRAWAFLGGTPFDAGLPAWRAVRDAGVRWALSATAVERIS